VALNHNIIRMISEKAECFGFTLSLKTLIAHIGPINYIRVCSRKRLFWLKNRKKALNNLFSK
jgi:hypothetical protein